MISVPQKVCDTLRSLHREFIWNGKKAKIKHSSLIGKYRDGGLKDVDIDRKILSLEISWVRQPKDSDFHPWRVLANRLLSPVGGEAIFHTNLCLSERFRQRTNDLPLFYKELVLEMSEEDKNLPYLYWTPKLHKVPFKHRFIAGSSKCTTKDLSCLLTKVLTTVKDGLIRYNNTKTSRNGVNSMWILKNSTSLLSSLDQLDVRTATSVQTYDFSTLYTSIPHNLLKSRITALIHNSFKRRNGSNRSTHIKITSGKGYFIDTINPGGDNLYTADQICRMVEFLIDNIFVKFGGCLFRQVIGIPMGTNCAPLLADLFLYSYERNF